MAAESETQRSVRGPLRYQIGTSSPQLEAGRAFSFFIRITNPYEIPIKALRVTTMLPVGFEDIGNQRYQTPLHQILWRAIRGIIQFLSLGLLLSNSNVTASNSPFKYTIACSMGTDQTASLQPGNSTVEVFLLRTKRSVFFSPSLYNLYLKIEYEINGELGQDTVNYQFNVRPPLKALILGSLYGSVIGYFLRDIYDQHRLEKLVTSLLLLNSETFSGDWDTFFQLFVAIIGSMMLAAVLVIGFARKKELQPILSIEDFWGGFFVGFLAGYTGSALVNQFLPQLKIDI